MYFYFKSIKTCLPETEYWKCNGPVTSGDYGFNTLDKRLINFSVFSTGAMVRWRHRNSIDTVARITMCKHLVPETERVNSRPRSAPILYDRCKPSYDALISSSLTIIFNSVIALRQCSNSCTFLFLLKDNLL